MPTATRHVARRDGQLEGEPDLEPSGKDLDEHERARKEAQRDLTSLSTDVKG